MILSTGVWAFPALIDDVRFSLFFVRSCAAHTDALHLQQFPEGPKQTSGPFWVGSGLAFVSALIALVLIPEAKMDGMTQEDERFREYLQANGYDVSQMGTHSQLSSGVDSAYEVDTRGEDKKASQLD